MGSSPTPGTENKGILATLSFHPELGFRQKCTKGARLVPCGMARGRIFRRQGGYAYRVDLGPDPATGKRRQVQKQGFRTKREAETALDEQLSSIRTGSVVAKQHTEVAAFLEGWLEGQRTRLKPSTWESYRIVVQRIVQRMGRVKLQALTPIDVERFYDELAATGWDPGLVRIGVGLGLAGVVLVASGGWLLAGGRGRAVGD